MNDDFLYGGDDGVSHNGACIANYWANWDLCNMASVMAIGILCDDGPMFDRAVNYFRNGAGNGSIRHAVPFLYDSQGLAQWQESGRDQGHTMMGMGQMGAICEMAWNQGVDLYGAESNRFMKAAQYVAKRPGRGGLGRHTTADRHRRRRQTDPPPGTPVLQPGFVTRARVHLERVAARGADGLHLVHAPRCAVDHVTRAQQVERGRHTDPERGSGDQVTGRAATP
ncbi:alginate lyase family protein [Nonomuraea angiospora]|uniref:alginate lyase family protein n=1 Tax=Nonomuraea angiospora TaxID=46172 RepID=UPI0034303B2D